MPQRAFDKGLLQDLTYGGGPDTFEVIEDQITGQTRWSVKHTMVFRADDGKYYQAPYSSGATELQDEAPFEYDDESILLDEVEPVEYTATKFLLIKDKVHNA